MQLSWTSHSSQLIDGIAEILDKNELLDVTLTAEGKQIRAHKIILSAASTYFRVSFKFIIMLLKFFLTKKVFFSGYPH